MCLLCFKNGFLSGGWCLLLTYCAVRLPCGSNPDSSHESGLVRFRYSKPTNLPASLGWQMPFGKSVFFWWNQATRGHPSPDFAFRLIPGRALFLDYSLRSDGTPARVFCLSANWKHTDTRTTTFFSKFGLFFPRMGNIFLGGQRPLVPLLLLGLPFFPIILFGPPPC
jgi:hypothetical protein